jgi:hypothetical protein
MREASPPEPSNAADLFLPYYKASTCLSAFITILPNIFWHHHHRELLSGAPDAVDTVLGIRILHVIIALVGAWAVYRSTSWERYSRRASMLLTLLLTTYAALLTIKPEGAGYSVQTVVVYIMGGYFSMPNSRRRGATPVLLFSVYVFLINHFWLSRLPTTPAAMAVTLAVPNMVGLTGMWLRRRMETRLTQALRAERVARGQAEQALTELRVLQGIIPICSHCKSVRTEVGEWQRIERYVRERSGAEFSHGICPDCAADVLAQFERQLAEEERRGQLSPRSEVRN